MLIRYNAIWEYEHVNNLKNAFFVFTVLNLVSKINEIKSVDQKTLKNTTR